MKILVVCGAGASSTFVAQRMRRAARERGLDVAVAASSEAALGSGLAGADVLLLGAHLAERAESIGRQAAAASVAVAVMPESVFSSPSGELALDLALDVVRRRDDSKERQ